MTESAVNEVNSATIIVKKDDGCQATYLWEYFVKTYTRDDISVMCNSPNLGYRFENQFDRFLFYRDIFGYDDAGGQHRHPKLVGIEEGDLGEDSARDKCLELLLADNDILYKTVFIRSKDSLEMKEVTTPHAGWAE